MPRYEVERARDLGALVAGLRAERGVSQADLADSLGFSRGYLSELESGRVTTQVARLFRVLQELDVRVEVSWSTEATSPSSIDD